LIVLNKYDILEEVGRGGMGIVYRAHDTKLNRTVAIKELVLSELIIGQDKKDVIARFEREALAAAKLSHPNIVTIFDVGEEDGRNFIVMEFLEGKTLKDYLEGNLELSLENLLDILIQIVSGLDHAHSKGIIHRDIKPDNMKVLDGNVVKITDFGIARIEDSISNLTQDGTMLGTLGYISPEQLRSSKGVDGRSDIFSFGAMLYELLTKKLPFDGGTVGATILKIMTETPIAPKKINPEIPEPIERIIMKCLLKDPKNRYQNPREIIKELSILRNKVIISESLPPEASSSIMIEIEKYKKQKALENAQKSNEPKSIKPKFLEVGDSFFVNAPDEDDELSKDESIKDEVAVKDNVIKLHEIKEIIEETSELKFDKDILFEDEDDETISNFTNSIPSLTLADTIPPEKREIEKYFESPFKDYKKEMSSPSIISRKEIPSTPVSQSFDSIRVSFLRNIGKQGTELGQFSSPKDIAVSNHGLLYVADTQNKRVQAFDCLGNWQFVIKLSEMQSPCAVAVDNSEKVYIADSMDSKIRIFDKSGHLLKTFGGKGTGRGEFTSIPNGIAIGAQNKIYVADTDGYRIQVFDENGHYLTFFGKYGNKPGEFRSPYSLAIHEEKIYVLDYGIPRVQVIDKNGISRLTFGQRGTGKAQFNIPRGIGVDKLARVYVADTLNHRVQIFDSAGKWIYSFGSKGRGQEQFMGPESIAIYDKDKSIFVLDKVNNRVQVFTTDVSTNPFFF